MNELIVIDLDRDEPFSDAQQASLSALIVHWFAEEIAYQQRRTSCQHHVCQDVRAEAVRTP